MKTAVSLPEPVFEAAERLAQRLRVSRSRLYTDAIRRYVEDHRTQGVTERLNAVYGPSGEDSGLDPVLAELQHRALREES